MRRIDPLRRRRLIAQWQVCAKRWPSCYHLSLVKRQRAVRANDLYVTRYAAEYIKE